MPRLRRKRLSGIPVVKFPKFEFTRKKDWQIGEPRRFLWQEYMRDYATRALNEGDKLKIKEDCTFVIQEITPSGKKTIGAVEYYPEKPTKTSHVHKIGKGGKYVYLSMFKGIIPRNGRKMMLFLLDRLRKEQVDHVQLLCSKNNSFLIEYYRRLGFEVICSNQQGYVVMNLTLTR